MRLASGRVDYEEAKMTLYSLENAAIYYLYLYIDHIYLNRVSTHYLGETIECRVFL